MQTKIQATKQAMLAIRQAQKALSYKRLEAKLNEHCDKRAVAIPASPGSFFREATYAVPHQKIRHSLSTCRVAIESRAKRHFYAASGFWTDEMGGPVTMEDIIEWGINL